MAQKRVYSEIFEEFSYNGYLFKNEINSGSFGTVYKAIKNKRT